MTRRSAAVAAAIIMSAVVWTGGQSTAPPQPQSPQQTFRTSADVVMVNVAVMRGNVPVPGLTAADFQIRDNGVLQKVESVEATAVPIDLTMVLDVSGLAASKAPVRSQVAKATAQLNADIARIAAGLRPIDRVRVLASDTYVQHVVPLSPATAIPPVGALAMGGLSSNYDAILAAVLQPVDPARRHVVIASVKVFDTMSAVEAATVRDVASRSDTLLHIVLMQTASGQAAVQQDFQCEIAMICSPMARSWAPHDRSLIAPLAPEGGGFSAVPQLRPDGLALQAGAIATGGALHQGEMFSAPTLVTTLKKAFEDFRHSYVLKFVPQGVRREGWHTLSVTVANARGAQVRARNGYAVDEPDGRPIGTAGNGAPGTAKPAAAPAVPRTSEEFAHAFERGDRAAVRQGVLQAADVLRLYRDIEADGNPWPGAAGREAAYILELADARLTGRTLPGVLTRAPPDVARLIERFTKLARHPIEPDAFERAWHWAAVCLAEGRFLWLSAVAVTDRALQRFPNDPRFILASAIATDQKWRTHGEVGLGGVLADRNALTEAHVTDVVTKYRAATRFPETSTEAHVRLGWFIHRTGKHAEAIAVLDAAPSSPQDPALTYLRHLFKGHAFVALDRLSDAIVEYRTATQAVPGAQSARVALMSALAARGDSSAAQAIGQQVETSPPVGDPWWNYWLGDFRFYAPAFETLRAMNSERR